MPHLRDLLGFTGFSCYALFVSALVSTTHTGYTVNIYSAVPAWGWLAFAVSLICGTLLIYIGTQSRSQRAIIYGSVLVFVTFGVFWFLARFLGFRFWSAARGDLLHHYGLAKSVVKSGSVPNGVVYPPLHVLLAQIHTMTGIQYGTLGPILSIIYYPLLIIGVVAVVRRLSSTRVALYVVIAGIPLTYQRFSQHLTPWVTFLALTPWLFILLDTHRRTQSRRRQGWLVIGIITLGVGIAVGHPMSALIGGAAITILDGVQRIGSMLRNSALPNKRPLPLQLLIPLSLIYPVWYLSRTTFQRFLRTIVGSIFGDIQGSGASAVLNAASSSYTFQQLVVEYLIQKWGTALLVIGVGGLIAAAVSYRTIRRRASVNEISLFALYVAGLLLAVTLLAGNFITNGYAVYRINQLTIVAAFVLIGCALWWSSEYAEMRALRYPLLVVHPCSVKKRNTQTALL